MILSLLASQTVAIVRHCDVVGNTLAFGFIGCGFESEYRLFSHHSESVFSKLRSLAYSVHSTMTILPELVLCGYVPTMQQHLRQDHNCHQIFHFLVHYSSSVDHINCFICDCQYCGHGDYATDVKCLVNGSKGVALCWHQICTQRVEFIYVFNSLFG